MREVELITTQSEMIGIEDDRSDIQRYRMQSVDTRLSSNEIEGCVPITCDIENLQIRKLILNGGNVRYYAVDDRVNVLVNDLMEHANCAEQRANHYESTVKSLSKSLVDEAQNNINLLDRYSKNICAIRRMNWYKRLVFLMTGIILK